MRGKGEKETRSFKAAGITPAYAGKSLVVAGVCYDKQDHPRLCGEKSFMLCFPFCQMGSPPPMRGKARGFVCKEIDRRITPAYAGKRGFVS